MKYFGLLFVLLLGAVLEINCQGLYTCGSYDRTRWGYCYKKGTCAYGTVISSPDCIQGLGDCCTPQ